MFKKKLVFWKEKCKSRKYAKLEKNLKSKKMVLKKNSSWKNILSWRKLTNPSEKLVCEKNEIEKICQVREKLKAWKKTGIWRKTRIKTIFQFGEKIFQVWGKNCMYLKKKVLKSRSWRKLSSLRKKTGVQGIMWVEKVSLPFQVWEKNRGKKCKSESRLEKKQIEKKPKSEKCFKSVGNQIWKKKIEVKRNRTNEVRMNNSCSAVKPSARKIYKSDAPSRIGDIHEI